MTADPSTELRAKAATLPADMSPRARARALGLRGPFTQAEYALIAPAVSPVDPHPVDPTVAAALAAQEQAEKEYDAADAAYNQAMTMRAAVERDNRAARDAVLGNMMLRPNGATADDEAEQRRAAQVVRMARAAETEAAEVREDAARRLTKARLAFQATSRAAELRASADNYAASVAAQEERLATEGIPPRDLKRRPRGVLMAVRGRRDSVE